MAKYNTLLLDQDSLIPENKVMHQSHITRNKLFYMVPSKYFKEKLIFWHGGHL